MMKVLRGGSPDGPIVSDLTVERTRTMVDGLQEHIDHGDDEAHYSDHDDIMDLVLTSIVEGRCDNSVECAKIALEPFEHDMQRWFA